MAEPDADQPARRLVRADLEFTEEEIKLIYRLRTIQGPTAVQVIVQNGHPLFLTILAKVESLTRNY